MKALLIAIGLSSTLFFVFLVLVVTGFARKNKKLKLASLVVFIAFAGYTGQTVYTTFFKVVDVFSPRSGIEIYDALFGSRETYCVNVLNYQDQVIPKIDYAIWLHVETCPAELERILLRHDFSVGALSTEGGTQRAIPLAQALDWFEPHTMGDTIMVYEYASEHGRNIQTIWANQDSTEIFVRDILD